MADVSAASLTPPSSYNPISFGEYYNQRGNEENDFWIDVPPDHWLASVNNFFTGARDKYQDEYEKYKQNYDTNSAREYERWLQDTKYQRAVQDLKKAGLNPWLLVQNGSLNNNVSTNTATSAKKEDQGKGDDDTGDKIGKLVSSALKIVLLAAMLG